MAQNTTTHDPRRPTITELDTDRLALLWRAFEEAEQRIGELERELDRARAQKTREAPAHVPTMPRPAPVARPAELVETEARLKESHEREARLVADLDAARRAAEAEHARYALAKGIIQHENANARKLEDEKATILAALDESRREVTEIETTRLALAGAKARAEAERDAMRAMVERERTEAAMQAARVEVARYVMEAERTRADAAEAQLGAETERAEVAEMRAILAHDRATSSGIMAEHERERAAIAQFLAREAALRAEAAEERVRIAFARPPVVIHVPVPVEVPAHVPAFVRAPPAARVYPVERLYPIDASRIAEIPGVAADEVHALRRVGFNMSDALLYADLAPLAAATDIGLPRLAKLRALAELMALNGIGPEWAERLYRAGARSIADIAGMSAADLEATLVRSYDGEGLTDEARSLFERTLPARCVSVVGAAKKAVRSRQ